ncbi:MAG: HNH endonuclease [Muribaculaceae bacterium]|nr:HNH endonuclease [Muribaculaceae bacterium]
MSDIERNWHPDFEKYTEFIASHPNYKGLLCERVKDGRIKWVTPEKTKKGKIRKAWWTEKCNEMGIPIQKGCYAIAARMLHPTKKHVCQCCGREMSIYYEYPGKITLRKLSKILNVDAEDLRLMPIREIIESCDDPSNLDEIAKIFGLPKGLTQSSLIDRIYHEFVEPCSTKRLSPGVMSNAPDRFDGFHSDGLCCREKTDKGRHSVNMKTYTQDRRAYKEWADGDKNLANRLMGEFQKDEKLYKCPRCGKMKLMSADHIGPISLGFRHTVYNFAPLCDSCNSAKNNRFYEKDVKRLLELEKNGHDIISWHSKYIWDCLKTQISNDDDAKRLSNIMTLSHQNVLKLLANVYHGSARGAEFLMRYLHPECCMYDYRFKDFDPFDLSKLQIKKTPRDSKNKRKNQERYVRISFEALDEFVKKDNRRIHFYVDDEEFQKEKENIVAWLNKTRFDEADVALRNLVNRLQQHIINLEWQ